MEGGELGMGRAHGSSGLNGENGLISINDF